VSFKVSGRKWSCPNRGTVP